MGQLFAVGVVLLALSAPAFARGGGASGTGSNPSSHGVSGYTKKDGTKDRHLMRALGSVLI